MIINHINRILALKNFWGKLKSFPRALKNLWKLPHPTQQGWDLAVIIKTNKSNQSNLMLEIYFRNGGITALFSFTIITRPNNSKFTTL